MLRLMIFIVVLMASVWLGLLVIHHPGYLLLVIKPWMIQMPVWLAILGFVILLAIFYLIINSIDRLQFFGFRLGNWLRLRREHQTYSKTQCGLTKLIEGNWKKAENLLTESAKQSQEPLMNYLGAARAAHEQGAFDRRDSYIQNAYKVAANADLAIGLTQAEMELAQDQLEHAAATLNRLRQSSPRHPRVLKLLEKVYVRLADWKNLEALLPGLRKAKLIDAKEEATFEKNIYCELLNSAANKNIEELHKMWNDIPRAQKKNPDVVYAYVQQLQRFTGTKEIEDLIRSTLKQHYHPGLVHLYGELPVDNLNRQLVMVGAWMKMYGQKPALLLLLGKLCMRAQLWGKARDYFDKCITIAPNAEAWLMYGRLLEYLGETDQALAKYREGLALVAAARTE